MEDVLSKSLCRQERWVTLTEDYLLGAAKRVKDRKQTGQRSLTQDTMGGVALHILQ
jgi:hypothetical protein